MDETPVEQSQAPEEQQEEVLELVVTLVTGERLVYEGRAHKVTAPAVEGPITILPHHAPLLAMLQPGELDIVLEEEQYSYAVGGGFLEVLDDEIVVLADSAERAEEIDIARAEAARRRAEMLVRSHQERPEILAQHRQALRRSRARLRVARKARRPRGRRS
jgi:F-type H+-transporting ATPase subunit epsilon